MSKAFLTTEWLQYFNNFTKLIVGFSGGLDSTVLLHLLANSSLRSKIIAVHVNHGISEYALTWQEHCEKVCKNLKIEYFSKTVEFDRSANVEEGARLARHEVFSSLISPRDCLVLAHHQDDQAETLLLQLCRGTGIDGMAGMAEKGVFSVGSIARPLLTYSCQELEDYAKHAKLSWINDDSNQDTGFSRNFLRHEIIPPLQTKWPAVLANIARAASLFQQAQLNLDRLALLDCPELTSVKNTLSTNLLKNLSHEQLSNVLKYWLKANKVKPPGMITFQRLIDEVLDSRRDANPIVQWGSIQVRRYQDTLYLDSNVEIELESCCWTDFPNPLLLAGEYCLEAKLAPEGVYIREGASIQVKYRQGGETIRLHGQSKQLKKLFQDWGVPPWQRDKVPLVYVNDQLAAVVGYAVSDLFYRKEILGAWQINLHK